jgi:hypothetical protein
MKLEKFLVGAMALVLAGAVSGCETDEETDGGMDSGAGGMGGMGGEGGMGGGGGTPPAEYHWVLLIDASEEENMAGTAGADICGVTATCGGTDVPSVGALLLQGEGSLCTAVDEAADCSADRTDATAAQDDGSSCEAASTPSDYVSLGMGGILSVDFGQDLSGCTLNVVELVGNQVEGYEVYVCSDNNTDAGTCLNDAALETAATGGDVEVTVP